MNLVIAGGPSGRGGLHAVVVNTGKLKWSYRPADIKASVSTTPAIVRDLAIAAYGASNPGAVIAVCSPQESRCGVPDPATSETVVASGDMAFVQDKEGNFLALDALTGKELWRRTFSRRRFCVSSPAVLDGVVYVAGGVDAIAGDASRPDGFDSLALDAKTGQERWLTKRQLQRVSANYECDSGSPHSLLRVNLLVCLTILFALPNWFCLIRYALYHICQANLS